MADVWVSGNGKGIREYNGFLRASFFDEATEFFSLYDKDLNVIDANQAVLDQFHFQRDQIIGKNLLDLVPNFKNSARHKIYKKVLRTGKKVFLDEVTLHPSLGSLRLRVNIFKVGEDLGVSATNITDLNETIEELETFIYRSCHDMRGPIANMLGIVNLAEKIPNGGSEKQYWELVKKQTEHLDAVLQKLIETARIRKGEKTFHLINFRALIEEVVNSFAGMEGFNKIRFEYEVAVSKKFYTDKRLLISLFQNLIDNAIKYKRELNINPFIRVSVFDERGGVKIVVSDNGTGIERKIHKDVFKMFFRGSDKASGIGLGLYTVKHCIKKLGGRISLDSRVNEGTNFTIHLPGSLDK